MEQVAMMILQTCQIYAARLEHGPIFMEHEALMYEKLCEFCYIYAVAQYHTVEMSAMLLEQQKISAVKVHQEWLEKRAQGRDD
jgi:hypothetical protein